MKEVSKDFLLAIWSSASDDYVVEVANNIIPKGITLEFIWGRSRCTYQRNIQVDGSGYDDDEYSNHYHYIKPLKKVKRLGYHLNRILIVDDSPHKSKENFGNAIYPTEFKGNLKDKELPQLSKYLKTLKDQENVRQIEKRNWQSIFK